MKNSIKRLKLNKETISKLNNKATSSLIRGGYDEGNNTVVVENTAVCSGICESFICGSTFCGSNFACGTVVCAGGDDGCGNDNCWTVTVKK